MSELNIEKEYENYENDNDNTPSTIKYQNTGDGPCRGCPGEFTNKDNCVDFCLRLKAFQYNREYRLLPYYQKTVTLPQIANAATEPSKTVEPITPKTTSWKKAMPIKPKKKPVPTPVPTKDDIKKPVNLTMKKVVQKPKIPSKSVELTYDEKIKIIRETTVCLVCGRDASKYKLRMGLCVARCSGAWRQARIEHPLLGAWVQMTSEEIHYARCGEYEKCLIPGCTKTGDRSELCRRHYRQWHGGRIEKPGVGKWTPKRQKKEGKPMSFERLQKEDKPVEDPVKYEINLKSTEELTPEVKQEKLISQSIVLDITNYQEIYSELRKQVELTKLPLAHVIFNLLSLGIMTAHDEEKRREKEV